MARLQHPQTRHVAAVAALLGVLLVSVLSGAWLPAGAQAADGQLNVAAAQGAFATAHRLCHADAGHLWGVSLCGRIMVADPARGPMSG